MDPIINALDFYPHEFCAKELKVFKLRKFLFETYIHAALPLAFLRGNGGTTRLYALRYHHKSGAKDESWNLYTLRYHPLYHSAVGTNKLLIRSGVAASWRFWLCARGGRLQKGGKMRLRSTHCKKKKVKQDNDLQRSS